MQTNSPTMGGLVPPMRWCGVTHPHEAHIWAEAAGMTGFYVNCPGSTGACASAPDSALGRCQAMLQCHRETGHQGGHEPDPGALRAEIAAEIERLWLIRRAERSYSSQSAVEWAVAVVRGGGHEAREENTGWDDPDVPESMRPSWILGGDPDEVTK